MKKFKVLKTAIIVCTLVYALNCAIYADVDTLKFNDIDNSWAKQYISNVFNKGLMGGFSETEFKPGENVKNYDALVSISRMVNSGKDINLEQLVQKYQTSVLDKFNVPEYAREHILVCLDKGIVSDADISQFAKYPYAKRKDISVYLGRSFGVVYNESEPPVVLAFKDSMMIPTLYKPHVKFLIDKGIVNGSGDVNGCFNPDDFIDRASFAKMLDLSSDVYSKTASGIDETDTTKDNPEIIWTDDNEPDDNEPDYTEPVPAVSPEDSEEADVTAYVDQVIPEYGNLAVFVGTERRVYKIGENAVCTIDGVSSEGYWKLKKSDLVKLYTEGDKVTKILGESKIRKTVGKLISIQTDGEPVLKMETLSGETKLYKITAKTIVIKDGKNALWQELKVDNELVITTSYNDLIEINADGVKSTDKGIIESLLYSRIAPPQIVITALDGSQNKYYVNKDMEITGAEKDLYSLRPGMQIEVNLIDDEIKNVAVINETAIVLIELKGMVKSIDLESMLVVIEVYDNNTGKYIDKKVYASEETKLADADLNYLSLDSLKANQIISVRGTGMVDGISAKTIQVAN